MVFPKANRVGVDAMFSPEFGCRCAGVEFSQDRDNLRLGESALSHVSLLAGLYARELRVSVCPNPRLQVRSLQQKA
jgi:hypothetical protein